ncbi:MAG: putative thiamine transporter permease protein [Ilumatobacteraceae bacterium]|nr:putative thiamine transporter permease protein [Ilumatobacteraceae bacterium]MCU1391411.1 putative thiamine transporter permease protein [Ilumatobacteraceae bacterium]
MSARDLNRLPRWTIAALAAPAIVFVGLFYAWPVVALIHRAVTAEAFRTVVHDASLRRVLWFTAWQAAISTAATVVVGLVPAWLLARYEFVGRRWLTALITVPFVLPTVVVGAAFLALLPRSLDQSVVAILVAHVFFNVAVVVRGVGGLWSLLPPDLVGAARTLGASPWRAMREVTLPLLAPAIEASASVVFLFSFTSFGVVRILGGPSHPTLEVEIWQRATRLGDVGVAAIVSIIQLVVLGLAVLWFARIQSRHRAAIGLRPVANRRAARGRIERATVATLSVAIVVAVGTPLAALFERSTRTNAGHSLVAWRAVFGRQQLASARPTAASSLDPLGSLFTSLRFAAVATAVSVVIGGCASLAIVAMSRTGGRSRLGRALDTGIMLPLGTSAVTIGFGVLVGFSVAPLDWRAAPLLIPLGHALVATPFVVRVLLPTLRSIDPRLRDAASTMGASPLRAWREIDMRVMVAPLLTGAGFAAAISLGEFGATTFLTRQGRATLPIAIEQLLARPGAVLHAEGYVLATVLALLTFVVIGAFEGVRSLGDRSG